MGAFRGGRGHVGGQENVGGGDYDLRRRSRVVSEAGYTHGLKSR